MFRAALKTGFTNFGFALTAVSFMGPFFYLLFTVEVTVCDQMHAAAFYLTKKNVFIASHSLPFVPAKGLEIMLHATAVNCACSCGGHSKIIHPCPVYALS